jgi:transposase
MAKPRTRLALTEEQEKQLEQLWEDHPDPRSRERLLVIRTARLGNNTYEDIAAITGCSRRSVARYLNRFEEKGLEGLLERGKPKPRPTPLTEGPVQEQWQEQLRKGNFRCARQAQEWLKKTHSIERSIWAMYYWLKKCGAKLLVPRPVHIKKIQQKTDAFPAELAERLPQLPLVKGRPIKIWVQDECRVGLHTVVRRAWGLSGHRLVQPTQKKYQWSYVYGAMEIGTGQIHTHLINRVDLDCSYAFLTDLAATDPNAEHIVIWDGAGFHQKEGKHELPERVHVIQLPPYSPELNPIEKLWDVVKDGICNKIYDSIPELWEAVLVELKPFQEQADRVFQILGNAAVVVCANASSRINSANMN